MPSRRRCLVAVCLGALLGARPAVAQTAAGTLLDAVTHKPLIGARVILLDSALTAVDSIITDSAGVFYVSGRGAGLYVLRFSFPEATVSSDPIRLRNNEFLQRTFTVKLLDDAPVYTALQVDQQATPHPGNKAPRYPEDLAQRREEGRVMMQFVVDTTGHVLMQTARALSATNQEFVRAVMDVLPDLQFFPARLGGQPVLELATMPFEFRINHSGSATVDMLQRIDSLARPIRPARPGPP